MPAGFSRLQVSGYRRLRDLDIQLAPFNVLIGANGVGKTSVLEVMSLLAASAAGRLDEAVRSAGGLSRLITLGHRDPLLIRLDRHEARATMHYELQLAPALLGYSIELEQLTQHQGDKAPFQHLDSRGSDIRYYEMTVKNLVRPTWRHNPCETSLSQVPKQLHPAERFREGLASLAQFHSLDVSPRAAVRQPQPLQPVFLPGGNGEYLASCLHYLQETKPDCFEAIEDSLSAAFPRFERLDVPVVAGQLSITWKERALQQPLYAQQLSDGALRFLWLVTLLQSPELPAVTLIDEPEVSLHPQMLRLLADVMREASTRTQLIVATHSDRLVSFLNPAELVVCDLDDQGRTVAQRGDTLALDEWMSDYTFDQLWSRGGSAGRS